MTNLWSRNCDNFLARALQCQGGLGPTGGSRESSERRCACKRGGAGVFLRDDRASAWALLSSGDKPPSLVKRLHATTLGGRCWDTVQCYLCVCGGLPHAEGHHGSNNAARCGNTRSIHRAALLFALQPTRSHAFSTAGASRWPTTRPTCRADWHSTFACSCNHGRAPEGALVAPPLKLLSTQARQCSHVPPVAATNA